MRDLRVAALTEDGEHVILVPGSPDDPAAAAAPEAGGERFRVRVDERLRAALRGTLGRVGQQPPPAQDGITPREIQARLRAGQSVDEIAEAAGVDPARVQRFAGPILAERDLACRRAAAAPVAADLDGTGTLGDRVEAAVRAAGHDPDRIAWDAARRDDGAWVVEARLPEGSHPLRAHFLFQPRSGRVTLQDEAAWLLLAPDRAGRPALRQVPPAAGPGAPGAPDAPAAPRAPSASEALAAVFRTDAPPSAPPAPGGQPGPDDRLAASAPTHSAVDGGAAASVPPAPAEAAADGGTDADAQPAAPADTATRTHPPAARGADPPRRVERKGRPSVPSWADILISTSERPPESDR